MGLYNLVFGANSASDVILATLGLTRNDVGRFRDCFITEGKIAVYTRNGGGNRECFCTRDPRFGYDGCKGYDWEREEDEVIWVPAAEVQNYPKAYNIFSSKDGVGSIQEVGTGKRILVKHHKCESPNSEDCACPGCTITYRLPKHPLYLSDEDDDFDCTYTTIYFKFPEEFAEDLKRIDRGEKFDPDQRWAAAIATLKGGT